MKNLIFPILLFFAEGVFGFETDGVKSVSVKEGDSVTLNTCLNPIQKYNTIRWEFENAVIARIKDQASPASVLDGPDGRFRDRLELDLESGSLTIRNIRTNHSGLYKVNIISTSGSIIKRFNVTVTGVFDPDADEIKSVSVMEGEPVTLNTDVRLQKDDLMLWKFARPTKGNPVHFNPCQSDATAIAKIDGETREISLDSGDRELFNNRLKVDKLSGSLTISNVRSEHSGFYILQISNNAGTKCRRFSVTVGDVTRSHSHVVWMSIALVLMFIMTVACLAAGIKNWNVLFGRVRSYNCFQSKRLQETEPKTVTEGQSLTLDTKRTELQRGDVIEWRFKGSVIARISRAANKTNKKTHDGADERFKDRLELDSKTGSLTITDTRTTDSEDYQLLIANNGKVQSNIKFNVSVQNSSQNRRSESESLLKSGCSRSSMEVVL